MQQEMIQARKIVRNKDICGGVPIVEGSRIRISDIAVLYDFEGLKPEQIADEFPTISIADVFSALTYYTEHREEIRKEIKERKYFFERVQQQL